ncbi:MAG: GAF and ANTAR domain-containing protein [Microlunatus sp.]|nr:GAF and ANTAR domain-containing protein [Microlunatus sp.]
MEDDVLGAPGDLQAAEEFSRLAQELSRQGSEGPTLDRIVSLAVETIDGCDYCGISLRDPNGRITTPAATDPIVDQVNELQHRLQEGPCLDVSWALDTFFVDNMFTDTRWPRWTPEATRLGIGSTLSVLLDAPAGQSHASLNLYAEKPYAFDPTDLAIASIYARHAGTALGMARAHDQMSAAMHSRQIIGVAQGILIQRFGLTLDSSFEVLRRYSQDHNIKLRTIAQNLVNAGGLPKADRTELDKVTLAPPADPSCEAGFCAH